MGGGQKIPGDWSGTEDGEGLSIPAIVGIAVVIVLLVVVGGIFLSNPGLTAPAQTARGNTEPAASPTPTVVPDPRDTIFQVSTINALAQGAYEGAISVHELERHGDFGTGVFDSFDGELVALDGRYYIARSDGSVRPADPASMVPFAMVTVYDDDYYFEIPGGHNLSMVTSTLTSHFPSKNRIYAIRAEGKFPEIVIRAVPRQQKPYPPLSEVAKGQSLIHLNDTTGTLVGYYIPPFMDGLNIPGYQFHYISADGLHGGHVFDLRTPDPGLTVHVDETTGYTFILPGNDEFSRVDLSPDISQDLTKAEQSYFAESREK